MWAKKKRPTTGSVERRIKAKKVRGAVKRMQSGRND